MNIRAITFGIVCLLLVHLCKAQTCTGSLGDPVVKIDFGSGSATLGGPLAAGTTGYNYVSGTPADGEYTIANTTTGMHPGNWWPTTDHTGNTGGYMMVVNASYNPDVFYKQTVNGLCPGTTYELAAWIMNLLTYSGIKPNVTFRVEDMSGNKLQEINTGDITESGSATWKQYGLTFTTPATQTSVVIKMINNAVGGNGNDLLLDDITFRPCGPSLVAGFGSGATSTAINCTANPKTDTIKANVAATSFAVPMYQWQVNTGSGWTNIAGAISTTYIFPQPSTLGTYQYRLASADGSNIASANCITVSNAITLTVAQSPTATAGSNGPTVCEGTSLTLLGGGGTTYSWTDPNGAVFSTLQNPVINSITPAQAGKYIVTAIMNGCTSQASVTITVQPKITAVVTKDTSICAGQSVQLKASGGISYKWTPSTGLSNDAIANPVATPASDITYTVIATNASCSSTAGVKVIVVKNPTASAGSAKNIIQGQSVQLTATATGSRLTYLWTPSAYLDNPKILNPTATPPVDMTYTLHVMSSCSTVIDSVKVNVFTKVTVPNAFSPNGDSINDTWDIIGLPAYPESVLSVFSRNGQMVYNVTGYSKPWDGTYNGKILPEGAYYYIIDLKVSGMILSGNITIVR